MRIEKSRPVIFEEFESRRDTCELFYLKRPSLAHSTIGHVAIAHRAIRHIKLRTVRLDTVLLRTVRLDTVLWRTVRLDTVAFGHNTYSCIYASIKLIIIGNIIKIV